MSLFNWIKKLFKRESLSDVFNSRLESHQEVKDDFEKLEEDKILEDVTPSTQQLYGFIDNRRSKVYHILEEITVGGNRVIGIYKSICSILNQNCLQHYNFNIANEIPSNRRLCKLCEKLNQ